MKMLKPSPQEAASELLRRRRDDLMERVVQVVNKQEQLYGLDDGRLINEFLESISPAELDYLIRTLRQSVEVSNPSLANLSEEEFILALQREPSGERPSA